MIGAMLGFVLGSSLFHCNPIGDCTYEERNKVVINMCIPEKRPGHEPKYDTVTNGQDTLIIYYVRCEGI